MAAQARRHKVLTINTEREEAFVRAWGAACAAAPTLPPGSSVAVQTMLQKERPRRGSAPWGRTGRERP
jgi:hypothetical protein